jgi:hypothetical protein
MPSAIFLVYHRLAMLAADGMALDEVAESFAALRANLLAAEASAAAVRGHRRAARAAASSVRAAALVATYEGVPIRQRCGGSVARLGSPSGNWRLPGWPPPGHPAGKSRPDSSCRYARSTTRSGRSTPSWASAVATS